MYMSELFHVLNNNVAVCLNDRVSKQLSTSKEFHIIFYVIYYEIYFMCCFWLSGNSLSDHSGQVSMQYALSLEFYFANLFSFRIYS